MDLNASRAGHRWSHGLWRPLQRLPCGARAELLDLPQPDPVALRGNLADLARVNRFLGGTQLSRRALTRLLGVDPRDRPVRLLDLGAGLADIPATLRDEQPLQILAIDRSLPVLQIAQPGAGGATFVAADGTRLPLVDDAVDVAHCSLLLHHLDPPGGVALLSEMARVARLGVIVNDLTRSRFGLTGAWLLAHIGTRNPLTRHDAPLSVRRAYTLVEMGDLVHAAGLRVLAIDTSLGYRAALTAVPS